MGVDSLARSRAENSARMAVVAVAISSVACGPTAAAPSSWPVSASAIHLTKPVVSPAASALPRPEKRNFPTFTARFSPAAAGFAQADSRDLGRGEDHGRDQRGMGAPLAADRVFRGCDPLGGGEMGELDFSGDVADRVDRRDFGAAILVGVDEAARIDREPGVFEPQSVGHWLAADRVEHELGAQRFVAEVAAHALGVGGNVL